MDVSAFVARTDGVRGLTGALRRAEPRRRRRLWVAIPALALIVGCAGAPPPPSGTAPDAPAASRESVEGAPDIITLGFGTGLAECDLTGMTETFRGRDRVFALVRFIPPLPAGGTVTMTLERDGRALPEYDNTVTDTNPSGCAFVELLELEPGPYRMEAAITPSVMPPLSGEFKVVP